MGKPDAQSMAVALMETHPYPLDIKQAAAELRRLSAVEAQRDTLLEALQDLCDTLGECGMTEKARAAIKAVEETK